MADEWIIDKPELTTPADDDLLTIIDVSDPGLTTVGTEKKIQLSNLIPADHGNVNAAADLPSRLIVTGADSTDVETSGITVDEIATPDDNLPLSLNVSAARNWTHIEVPDSQNWSDVIATNTNFLICSPVGGIIKISLDLGFTWIDPTTPIAVGDIIQAMAYDKRNSITLACSIQGNVFRSLDDGDTWATVNLDGLGSAFQDVRFSNNVFIAVGASIIYSTDGSDLSWTTATFPALPGGDIFHDCAFGNGRWIVVGGGANTFAYSSDDNGRTWADLPNEPPVVGAYDSIIFVKNSYYPNGSFFATRNNGELLKTANGDVWEIIDDFSTGSLVVFYAAGQWLLGTSMSRIITSWDSVKWTTFTALPNTELLSAFAFKQNVFISTSSTIAGDVFRSTLPDTIPGELYENDGESDTSVIPSTAPDLDNFLRISSSQGWERVGLVAVAGSNFFNCAVGNSTAFVIAGPNTGEIRRSTDNGVTWSTIVLGFTNTWHGAAYAEADNIMIMVGVVGGIITSTNNGSGWTQQAIPFIDPIPDFRGVAYGNNRYVVGGGDNEVTPAGSIFYSDDSETWVIATIPALMPTIRGVAHSGINAHVWVAVGGDTGDLVVLSVDNGVNWGTQTIGTSAIMLSVTFGNNRFAATSADGEIFTSPDGITWALETTLPAGETQHINFADNEFIVCGDSSAVYTSSDATTWIKAQVTPDTSTLTYTAFANNTFIASSSAGDVTPEVFRSSIPAIIQEGQIFVGTGQDAVTVKPGGSELLLSARRTTDFDFDTLPQDVPVAIPLDAGTYDTPDVSIAQADGLITFKTIGTYELKLFFVYGRDVTTNQVLFFCGLELNGAAVQPADIRMCAKQDANDTWTIDNGTLRIKTTATNQTLRFMLWTDSSDEDTILLKAPFSNYQSTATPSLTYQIWRVS